MLFYFQYRYTYNHKSTKIKLTINKMLFSNFEDIYTPSDICGQRLFIEAPFSVGIR